MLIRFLVSCFLKAFFFNCKKGTYLYKLKYYTKEERRMQNEKNNVSDWKRPRVMQMANLTPFNLFLVD